MTDIDINVSNYTLSELLTIVGIENEDKEKLFQMFQSFDSNHNSTGIGLSIVRRIIENANEKVWFESEKSIGSVFYFTMQKK